MTVHVMTYDTADPGDVSDLNRALAAFSPSDIQRLCLLVKTEGNSDVNDYSREYGLLASKVALKEYGGQELLNRSSFLFSTGCEGAMTPFGYLFIDVDDGAVVSQDKALVFSGARSRPLRPEEIGTPAQSDIVSDTVRAAMAEVGVEVADVELVIVKTPIMSHIPAVDAAKIANKRITSAYSKAVGALGAGVALNEVNRSRIVQTAFNVDHSLHAKRAMVFSGSETDRVEILLLANRRGAPGDLRIQTGFFADLLDAEGVRATFRAAGCEFDDRGQVRDADRVAAVLVKAGVVPNGSVRGYRTKIKTSHIDMDLHLRATMSGIIGSILGNCRVFISANTVHQAPQGGGICACIVRGGAT